MNIPKTVFSMLSKGFDISTNFTKDDDIKDILIGISAIFALCVTAAKIAENVQRAKSIFRKRKISKKRA